MWILALVSLAVIAVYTAVVTSKQGGIPDSISATFYRLEHKKAFTTAMLATGILLLPPMLEVSAERVQWLALLCCVGFLAVGSSPHYHDEFQGKVHTAGAVTLLVGSQAWVAATCPCLLSLWLLPFVAFLFNPLTWRRHHPLFWIEATAIATGYGALFLNV